jgi:hypothetical protein
MSEPEIKYGFDIMPESEKDEAVKSYLLREKLVAVMNEVLVGDKLGERVPPEVQKATLHIAFNTTVNMLVTIIMNDKATALKAAKAASKAIVATVRRNLKNDR